MINNQSERGKQREPSTSKRHIMLSGYHSSCIIELPRVHQERHIPTMDFSISLSCQQSHSMRKSTTMCTIVVPSPDREPDSPPPCRAPQVSVTLLGSRLLHQIQNFALFRNESKPEPGREHARENLTTLLDTHSSGDELSQAIGRECRTPF